MKVIKAIMYIAQIIGSVVYTSLFVMIMARLVIYPIAWVSSLPWWGILFVLFIGGSVLLGFVMIIHTITMAPYMWLVHKNIVACSLSIISFIVNTIRYSVGIWEFDLIDNNWVIFTKIVMILSLLSMTCYSSREVVKSYLDIY